MSRESVRQEMKKIVEQYERGIESKSKFCEGREISLSKLSYWVNVFHQDPPERGNFVKLGSQGMDTFIRIRLPNGIEIECTDGIPERIIDKLFGYAGE